MMFDRIPETTVQAAERYRNRGMAPVHFDRGKKGPTYTNWQNYRPTEPDQIARDFAGKNVGVLTGKASGGLIDVDLDCPEAAKIAHLFLPKTDLVTGREKRPSTHYFYTVEEGIKSEQFIDPEGSGKGATLVEIRGDRLQTVMPPSTHPEGDTYTFTSDGNPGKSTAEELHDAVALVSAAALIARRWGKEGDGRQNKTLHLAGALAHSDMPQKKAEKLLEAICLAADDEEAFKRGEALEQTYEKFRLGERVTGWSSLKNAGYLTDREISAIIKWLKVKPATGAAKAQQGEHDPQEYREDDIGNSQRMADHYGESIKFVHDWKKWLIWNGRYHEIDEVEKIVEFGKEAVKGIVQEAADAGDDKKKMALFRHSVTSGREQRIQAMIRLTASLPSIGILAAELDLNPWYLNCLNGIVDLKTGGLMPHDKSALITKMVPVNYNPSAQCPAFLKFVSEIMQENEADVRFLQKALGYSLTGITRERVFFILWGDTNNGKSTLMGVIRKIMADYTKNIDSSTLIHKNTEFEGISNDIARLKGARLVTASETDKGQKLAEKKLKVMTGGEDVLTARFMRAEYFDFSPEFKIWLMTNHLPRIREDDGAIWGRVRYIPFNAKFLRPEEMNKGLRGTPMDLTLPDKLKAELEGILRWAVDGCLLWQKEGLNPTETLIEASKAYRKKMDIINDFVEDTCVRGRSYRVAAKEIFECYKQWCKEHRVTAAGKMGFYKRLEAWEGVEKACAGQNILTFYGLKISSGEDNELPNTPAVDNGGDSAKQNPSGVDNEAGKQEWEERL